MNHQTMDLKLSSLEELDMHYMRFCSLKQELEVLEDMVLDEKQKKFLFISTLPSHLDVELLYQDGYCSIDTKVDSNAYDALISLDDANFQKIYMQGDMHVNMMADILSPPSYELACLPTLDCKEDLTCQSHVHEPIVDEVGSVDWRFDYPQVEMDEEIQVLVCHALSRVQKLKEASHACVVFEEEANLESWGSHHDDMDILNNWSWINVTNMYHGKCDLSQGEWVPDPAPPLYTNNTCRYIQDSLQNCLGNGRSDSSYLHWRWKPSECDLPPFDPAFFLDVMRGKRLALIGDSLARNHMESLLCSLTQVRNLLSVYHF
ncbi:hypothetical protein L7F22_007583 [Adiantum nelumboides]|nr:hypothetical protein [Adiantum nelumboides]